MRVLALNYEFPPLGGGAGNATAHICRELVRLGCAVQVLTTWFPGTDRDEQRDGYRVRRIRALRRQVDQSSPVEMASFTLAAAGPALRLAREFDPHVVHVYFGVPTGPVGLLVKRAMGIPYLLSLRGGDVPGFLPGTLGTFHRLLAPLNRIVWNSASVIVANSEGLRDLAQDRMGLPVELVPNGVDVETFHPPGPHGAGGTGAGRRLRLLFVGRLVEQKGVRYLLQAASDLPVDIDIVGGGPEETALRRLAASLGLDKRVAFRGWLSRPEMPGCYQDADVFVFPSFEEGMPNVVLEAMASGLPVVATDIYGHRGLVENGSNGILVPTGDPEAIRVALQRLLCDHELRAAMGQASRERAIMYSWSAAAQAYLNHSRRAVSTLHPR